MTSARIQPFSRKFNNNTDCFNGTRINFRTIRQRIIALKLHVIHFCLVWKSNDISFNQARRRVTTKL